MRPYLAIDIEYSGRSKTRSEVMELGLVLDDGKKSIVDLMQANFVVRFDCFTYAEPEALLVNRRLLEAQLNPEIQKYDPKVLFTNLLKVTKFAAEDICYNWDVENIGRELAVQKVTLAGKNTASTVLPILITFFLRHGVPQESIDNWLDYVSDRHLDVASLYYQQFDYVPAMEQVNKLTGRDPDRKYMAIEDALDAVYAVRSARRIPYDGVNNR